MSEGGRELKEVERSPDGRYIRFDSKLGGGAYKAVWLGYDTELGIEVAWCLVETKRIPPRERSRIRSETEILSHLHHQHIINFYDVWENPDNEQIVFTTERVTSGSLKQYINRVKPLKLKVIKKWCRQILKGLEYLHSQNPPVIHRDLKCDNIFINGNNGELRIGDLGLSTMRSQTHVVSVLGTPEFMAPELYDEYYTEKVDIYAFGMCLLEMVTNEYPYQECTNPAQIYRKVSQGIMPESLSKIRHVQTRKFIEFCISPSDMRPSASDLLEHPFLAIWNTDIRDSSDAGFTFPEHENVLTESKNLVSPPPPAQEFKAQTSASLPSPSQTSPAAAPAQSEVTSQEVIVESVNGNLARIILRIHLKNKRQEIKFPFDLTSDTAESVAAEMVQEIGLATSARVKLADAIFDSLRDQKEKWKNFLRQKRDKINVVDSKNQSKGDPSKQSVDSNDGGNSDFEKKDVILSIDDVSIPTVEQFVREAELMTLAQLQKKVSEMSKQVPNKVLDREELCKLYVQLKIKENNSRRLSLLDQEINGEGTLTAFSGQGTSPVRPPNESNQEIMAFNNSVDRTVKNPEQEFIKHILSQKSFPLSPEQTLELKNLEMQRVAKLKQHKKTYLRNKISTNREYNFIAVNRLKEWGFDPASAAVPSSVSSVVNAEELAELHEVSNPLSGSNPNLVSFSSATTAAVLGADLIKSTSGHMATNPGVSGKLSARTKEAMNEIRTNQPSSFLSSSQRKGDDAAQKKGSRQEDLADLEQKMTQFLSNGLAASPNPQKY